MEKSTRLSAEYTRALLDLLESAKSKRVTICGLISPKSHIKDCILRSRITGCTIDGTAYDFNCTGSIWDSSEYRAHNQMVDAGNVNE